MAFRAPGADEYTESKFLPAAEDVYRVKIDRYEIKKGADTVNQWNPDGNPRVRFYLEPLSIEGDEDALMVDTKDEELPEDKFFIFFFDPDHLGTQPRLAKSRKFLASALQIPTDQPIEYESLEDCCDDLVGRELIVDVTVKGEYNNIADTRPVKARKPRKRVEREPLVEVAEEVFTEDASDDQDDY